MGRDAVSSVSTNEPHDELHEAKTSPYAQILDRGYTILQKVLPPATIESALEEYLRTFEKLRSSRSDRLQISHDELHYQMQPDLEGVFGAPEILANPVALKWLRLALGPDLKLAYFNSNLARPGCGYQRVHRDHPPLFAGEMNVPTPPFLLVANILLCDFTIVNGSTEVWPGTHQLIDRPNTNETLDDRVRDLEPVRTNAPAGSIIIRDLRLWHRGTPNLTREPRIMLSLVYKRNWIRWRDHKSLEASPEVAQRWPDELRQMIRR
jgi:ectoine hydroxylase-related dioxygenase (phytanoyl-CoA dioxygenase family)